MKDTNEQIPGPTIDRRAALGALAAVSAGAAMPAFASRSVLTQDQLGYDRATGEYVLPPLPYAYDALEPQIDAETMRIHHDKHHAGYVRGLNAALEQLARIRSGQGDQGLIKFWSRQCSFHGSGHVNHTMFWTSMAPAGKGGGGTPSGPLADAIKASFGSHDRFVSQFKAASTSVEASGWGWLVYEPMAGQLLVIQGEKQQDLMMTGVIPLLGVDVWEHAYYLKYQNRRGEYVNAFMEIINWPEIERRFQAATA